MQRSSIAVTAPRLRRLGCAFLLTCLCGVTAGTARPQAQAVALSGPRFDVASVRVVQTGQVVAGVGLSLTPGRFRAADFALDDLIRYAYSLPPYDPIKGGPSWLHFSRAAKRFIIEATFPPPAGATQVRAMLRALLAARFKLRIHNQVVPAKIYELRISGQFKFKPYVKGAPAGTAACPPAFGGYRTEHLVIVGTAAALAGHLSSAFHLPIVDKTGLKGRYFFSFCYAEPSYYQPSTLPAPPSLASAIRAELGLVVLAGKGEIQEYIVDHAEMPSPN